MKKPKKYQRNIKRIKSENSKRIKRYVQKYVKCSPKKIGNEIFSKL